MSPERETTQIPVGPLVAAIGAVLLAVSLFLEWYEDRTAFTVFELLDLVLVAAALAMVVQLAGGIGLFRPLVSPAAGLAVAIATLVIVVSQIVNHPPAAVGEVDKEVGIWLALAGAALMVAGAILATTRISLAVEPHGGGPGTRAPEDRAASADSPRAGDAPGASVAGPPRPADEPTRPLDDPPAQGRGT